MHVTRHRNNLSGEFRISILHRTLSAAVVHAPSVLSSRVCGAVVVSGVFVACICRCRLSIRIGPVVCVGLSAAVLRFTRLRHLVVIVIVIMSEQQPSHGGSGFSSRHKIASALQVIRKNPVYRSIVMRLGHATDTPKKCKKPVAPQPPSTFCGTTAVDDGGFGDWRTDGLPEHSHRKPSPPYAVSRSVSDYGVVRSSVRRQHVSDTKRVEEAYRRGFCDGSVADVFLMRQTAVQQQEQQPQKQQQTAISSRRRRPSSMDFANGSSWARLSSSSTVPANLGCDGIGDRVLSKSRVAPSTTVQVVHRSLPSSVSRFHRHRRLSLPVSSDSTGVEYVSQNSNDIESPSATVPTKAAAIALHQLIECYRNGYRVTDHKIALMLDILDTQQRLAKVKLE